jgi:protein involved in polysaccharide export with SLBB domain
MKRLQRTSLKRLARCAPRISPLGQRLKPLVRTARATFAFLLLFTAAAANAQTSDFLGVNTALGLTPPQTQTAPSPAPAAPAAAPVTAPQAADYRINQASDVFGASLFTGAFARQGATQFNPDYAIAIGDRIQLRLWGGFELQDILTVDPQGNIFLPHVGPVRVLGVRNQELQRVVEAAARKVFRANVYSYASLAAAQPVRIYVGGYVNRPGLYNGTSMDSLLFYLDQAGGVDPERGSFLDVQVMRGEQLRASVNLYDFLLAGRIPLLQLAEGDVIFVPARQNVVKVSGLAENTRRFEFATAELGINELNHLAKPRAAATHVRVVRNTGTVRNVEYYALAAANGITVGNGDEVEFTADKKPGTITVRVEGEHASAQEYVLPYGARLGELLKQIEYSERSDAASPQLFRRSVRERQKAMLQTALKSLESSLLTARSGTSDEARLRKEEADLILQWVDRAKEIEPRGQVFIAQANERDNLLLENGDILRIPTKDGLVLISGEVLFPNAVAYDTKLSLDDYIRFAGGYTQNAHNSRIVVAHRNGSFSEASPTASASTDAAFWWEESLPPRGLAIRPGDEILVLPKIDVKSRQIAKDLTQILYQIAISTKVVLGL